MQVEESYMAVNVVAVDNAPELLEKIEGIFRNMDGVSLLGTFEEAVAGYQRHKPGKRAS